MPRPIGQWTGYRWQAGDGPPPASDQTLGPESAPSSHKECTYSLCLALLTVSLASSTITCKYSGLDATTKSSPADILVMRYVPVAGCEDLEGYQPGGYHPVIIGDIFNRRYQVSHKLGSGGSATVWLAYDKLSERWVAVKVMMAKPTSKDLEMNQYLQKALGSGVSNPVVPLLDWFSIDGPNGNHLCLVFAVSGPSLASIRRRLIKIRPDVARSLALKLVKALEKIHRAGVVFGDLSAANVLLKLVDIDNLSLEDIYARTGQPSPEEVLEMPTEGTQTIPATSDNVPKFVYKAVDLAGADFEYAQADVQFIYGRSLPYRKRDHHTRYEFGLHSSRGSLARREANAGKRCLGVGMYLVRNAVSQRALPRRHVRSVRRRE